MPQPLDSSALRRYAVARTLFALTTLPRAIDKLGFVQADPIRAGARAGFDAAAFNRALDDELQRMQALLQGVPVSA